MVMGQLNRILGKFDFQVRRKSYTAYSEFLERLAISGIPINVIWDVGAFKGEWTKETRKYFPNTQFIMFEPNTQHNEYLNKVNVEYHNIVLGKMDGEVTFYSHGGTGDSIYPEFDETLQSRSESKKMECRTVDSIVNSSESIPAPNFLKLDVQGAEIDVLMGATKTIKSINVILLECPIVNYNWGSPNIHDYLDFMFVNNFVPFFVTEVHRLQQILTQIDLAFISEKQFESHINSLNDVGFWESTRLKYQRSRNNYLA